MDTAAVLDEGWAILAQPPGRRDLGCPELWARSLARSRRRRAAAERRGSSLPVGATTSVSAYVRESSFILWSRGAAALF